MSHYDFTQDFLLWILSHNTKHSVVSFLLSWANLHSLLWWFFSGVFCLFKWGRIWEHDKQYKNENSSAFDEISRHKRKWRKISTSSVILFLFFSPPRLSHKTRQTPSTRWKLMRFKITQHTIPIRLNSLASPLRISFPLLCDDVKISFSFAYREEKLLRQRRKITTRPNWNVNSTEEKSTTFPLRWREENSFDIPSPSRLACVSVRQWEKIEKIGERSNFLVHKQHFALVDFPHFHVVICLRINESVDCCTTKRRIVPHDTLIIIDSLIAEPLLPELLWVIIFY